MVSALTVVQERKFNMCVILEHKPGQRIHPEVIEACYTTNPHGFGIAWFDGNKVRITKGVKDLKSIQALVSGLSDYLSLIHFRWATIGEKVKENCHPFHVGVFQAAMMHNGSFPTRPRKTKNAAGQELQWSDTKEIGHILNSWSEDIIRRSLGKFKEWHGTGNRTALMMSNGEILKTGDWSDHEGLCCSNLNWKWKNYRKTQATGYSVNGKYYSRAGEEDLDSELCGMFGGNTHRTSGASNGNTGYGRTWRDDPPQLKVANQHPDQFIKYGDVWMSREQIAIQEREKKSAQSLVGMISHAGSAAQSAVESLRKTDSAQSANSNTVATQARGQTGNATRHTIDAGDEVILKTLNSDHFKVVINVCTKKDFHENQGKQRYLVYYWDFEKSGVRCEYCEDDLDEEIAIWKKTGMTIHLTEIFSSKGRQRIISPDKRHACQA